MTYSSWCLNCHHHLTFHDQDGCLRPECGCTCSIEDEPVWPCYNQDEMLPFIRYARRCGSTVWVWEGDYGELECATDTREVEGREMWGVDQWGHVQAVRKEGVFAWGS